jgi:hypothetical protein
MNRPVTLRRGILGANIRLEDLSGHLKGLDELKQGVAEDNEYQPHNANDPREEGVSNLSDVVLEPSHYSSTSPTTHPTGRLGQAILNIMTAATLALFSAIAIPQHPGTALLVGVVIAAFIWLAGRGLHYVLAKS